LLGQLLRLLSFRLLSFCRLHLALVFPHVRGGTAGVLELPQSLRGAPSRGRRSVVVFALHHGRSKP